MDKIARHYRLAFVVSRYFEYGGMQRTLLRIARACAARDHEVHLFTGEWRGRRPDGITVHEIDTAAMTNHASNRRLAACLDAVIDLLVHRARGGVDTGDEHFVHFHTGPGVWTSVWKFWRSRTRHLLTVPVICTYSTFHSTSPWSAAAQTRATRVTSYDVWTKPRLVAWRVNGRRWSPGR